MTNDEWLQHAPLSQLDDYMLHQTPDPIRVAATTDPAFYERHWSVMHDHTGDLIVAIGGSFYPNLDAAEAFVIVNYRGDHRSVRAFRPLGVDRSNLEVGPIKPRIVEGLRHWEFRAEHVGQRLELDLSFRDATRQTYQAMYGSLNSQIPGRQRHVTAGFESFGHVTGWVRFDNQVIEWSSGQAIGTRDRHWGIGRHVGAPPERGARAGWIGGNWVWLDDRAIWGRRVFYPLNDERSGAGKVVNVNRRLRFEEDTLIFVEGVLDIEFDDGTRRSLHYEKLGQQTAFMRCGLYGGSPDGATYQGFRTASLHVESDQFDVRQPEVRRALSGLNEHHCRVTDGSRTSTGILQPLEPDAYQACLEGRPGWSFL